MGGRVGCKERVGKVSKRNREGGKARDIKAERDEWETDIMTERG